MALPWKPSLLCSVHSQFATMLSEGNNISAAILLNASRDIDVTIWKQWLVCQALHFIIDSLRFKRKLTTLFAYTFRFLFSYDAQSLLCELKLKKYFGRFSIPTW